MLSSLGKHKGGCWKVRSLGDPASSAPLGPEQLDRPMDMATRTPVGLTQVPTPQ